MTRPKAISRVKKLLALARDRAATEPEKKLAKQRADALVERFEITESELRPDPVRRRRPQPVPVWGFATTFTNSTFTTATSGYIFNVGGGVR